MSRILQLKFWSHPMICSKWMIVSGKYVEHVALWGCVYVYKLHYAIFPPLKRSGNRLWKWKSGNDIVCFPALLQNKKELISFLAMHSSFWRSSIYYCRGKITNGDRDRRSMYLYNGKKYLFPAAACFEADTNVPNTKTCESNTKPERPAHVMPKQCHCAAYVQRLHCFQSILTEVCIVCTRSPA